MTAQIIPLHRSTKDLHPDVLAACHALWEALEKVPPDDVDYTMVWLERMYGIPHSVYDEVKAAKELREAAFADLDDHPDDAS
jgi:hypothetical protein